MKKLKEFFTKDLKHYVLLIFIVAILLDLIIEILGRHSLIGSLGFMIQHPLVFLCNVMLVFAVVSLALLFRKRIFAIVIFGTMWLVVGIINGIILFNRMTPFTVKDLSNLEDGLSIVTTYFSVKSLIFVIIGAAVLVVGLVFLYRKTPRIDGRVNFKKSLAVIAIVFIASFGMIQGGMKVGILDTFFGNLAYAYRDNGVTYSFFITWVKEGIDKPDEYTKETIEGIFTDGELGSDNVYTPGQDDNTQVENKPNILFLQLESFVDPTMIEGVEYSKDPIPNFRELLSEYSSGYLTVPAVGAGTANVEFEVMTGISAKFFGPGEYPYKSVLRDKTCESAPYDIKQLGYTTHAIHNHRGAFYGRNKVFANLGFDTFTCLEYMNNVTKTPKNWAKDGILTDEILAALQSTENQDYVYTISVQGHGKYPTEKMIENPAISVTKASSDEEKLTHEYYANQVYEMDLFIKDLTDALASYDEDVILVMYGDHLPALDMTEDTMKSGSLYETQYVIWDNFGMKKQDKDLAAYQLNAEVFKRLGFSVGLMNKYHQNYSDKKDYMANLKALSYDMLYGDKYIYGETNPFKKTQLKMGVKDIKIKEVVQIGEDYYIKGENFTEFSKISLDGKVLKTVYLGPTILALNEEVDPKDVSRMKVSQVEKNKEILSTTE